MGRKESRCRSESAKRFDWSGFHSQGRSTVAVKKHYGEKYGDLRPFFWRLAGICTSHFGIEVTEKEFVEKSARVYADL